MCRYLVQKKPPCAAFSFTMYKEIHPRNWNLCHKHISRLLLSMGVEAFTRVIVPCSKFHQDNAFYWLLWKLLTDGKHWTPGISAVIITQDGSPKIIAEHGMKDVWWKFSENWDQNRPPDFQFRFITISLDHLHLHQKQLQTLLKTIIQYTLF